MINLEQISHKMILVLFKNHKLDEIKIAKAEYGLSIILGIVIELGLGLLISLFFKTTFYTAIIMFSSLSLRIITGGAHCSSYDRCLIFTSIYFITASVFLKNLLLNWNSESLLILSILLLIFVLLVMLKNKVQFLFVIIFNGLIVLLSIALGNKHVLTVCVLSISFGLSLQTLMLTQLGSKIIKKMDKMIKHLGI